MTDSPPNERVKRRGKAGIPRATARLQFHAGFTFDQATALVPYYARLGVSHLYASPILKARPGSTHGYDCVDVGLVNPELGGEDALRRMAEAVHEAGMGLVVDIVPNHMGIGSHNAWWQDVLLWGADSRYAHYFDIDFQSSDPALRGKLLAPFLGAGYGETLASGDLLLALDDETPAFEVRYFDNRFPIAIADHPAILDGTGHAELQEAARLFEAVAEVGDLPRNDLRERENLLARRDKRLVDARTLLQIALKDSDARDAVDRALARFAPTTTEGRARLHALLENQSYRLSSWRAAADEINWRRFFEVTDLAGIRVERDDVFDAMHATIFRLYRDGVIDAVRVDHVDGLADPRSYCRELHRRLETLSRERPTSSWPRPWIVVEKILASAEDLRGDWKIDGTSGYDFMNEVGALLHDPQGAEPLATFWSGATLRPADFRTEQTAARRQILAENLAAEFNAAARALHRVARADIDTRDIALIAIQRALTELLVQFDVYRTYVDARGRSAIDTQVIVGALRAAHETVRPSDRTVLAWLDHWLGGDTTDETGGPTMPDVVPQVATRRQRDERRQAINRFQQLTPPLAAKSVEDTAFYRYGRLISRNEVGSDPGEFALTIAAFHAKCLRRLDAFPHAMLAVATHDHKRGADTRARLAVLSEMPQRWIATMRRWMILNTTIEHRVAQVEELVAENTPMTPPAGLAAKAHAVAESAAVPLPEDQLMLMQALIGAWPIALSGSLEADDATVDGIGAFVERVAAWQEKALRETKRPSDWSMPNATYEATCRAFLDRIMDPAASPFVREAAAFVAAIGPAAALDGLVQVALQLTVPGVPDLYQGTEFWDFSLVDPDNRRPVDFAARESALAAGLDPAALLANWRDGHVKQALIASLLALRRDKPELFASGDYQALVVEGTHAERVLAFLRRQGSERLLVVVPVHVAALLEGAEQPLVDAAQWADTEVLLPPGTASNAWLDVVTGRRRRSVSRRMRVADLLAEWPVAVLRDASRG